MEGIWYIETLIKFHASTLISMVLDTLMLIALLTLPLVAGVGLVIFMAKGKGKPAPTQDEILEFKQKRESGGTQRPLGISEEGK